MNISLITSPFGALPPMALGAVEKLFYQLAEEWVKKDHNVTFLCAGGGDHQRMTFIRLPRFNRTGRTLLDLIPDFAYSLIALFRCPRSDILLCNTFWSPFLAPLFRWKYKRLIYGVHRFPKNQFFLYPGVHLYICVSKIVEQVLAQRFHYDIKSITISNPCSIPLTEKPTGETTDVVYAGRIHPEKGLAILCQALEFIAATERKPLTLKLIGTWNLSEGGGGNDFIEHLKVLAPHIHMTFTGGLKDPRLLSAEMKSGALFCYPSVAEHGETFGVAPLEAMALGLPVVLSNLRCFEDFAANGKNALFFDHRAPDNVQQCARAINQLLKHPELRSAIGTGGKETARRFSPAHIAAHYINAFKEILRHEP